MSTVSIRLAEEFSRTPGPRLSSQGEASGEKFRETLLEPKYLEARAQGCRLVIDLDGAAGFAASFLEEAFGGLARKYPVSEVVETIEIVSTEEPELIEEIKLDIERARAKPAP